MTTICQCPIAASTLLLSLIVLIIFPWPPLAAGHSLLREPHGLMFVWIIGLAGLILASVIETIATAERHPGTLSERRQVLAVVGLIAFGGLVQLAPIVLARP